MNRMKKLAAGVVVASSLLVPLGAVNAAVATAAPSSPAVQHPGHGWCEPGRWVGGYWVPGRWHPGWWQAGYYRPGWWDRWGWHHGYWVPPRWHNGWYEQPRWVQGHWVPGRCYNPRPHPHPHR